MAVRVGGRLVDQVALQHVLDEAAELDQGGPRRQKFSKNSWWSRSPVHAGEVRVALAERHVHHGVLALERVVDLVARGQAAGPRTGPRAGRSPRRCRSSSAGRSLPSPGIAGVPWASAGAPRPRGRDERHGGSLWFVFRMSFLLSLIDCRVARRHAARPVSCMRSRKPDLGLAARRRRRATGPASGPAGRLRAISSVPMAYRSRCAAACGGRRRARPARARAPGPIGPRSTKNAVRRVSRSDEGPSACVIPVEHEWRAPRCRCRPITASPMSRRPMPAQHHLAGARPPEIIEAITNHREARASATG